MENYLSIILYLKKYRSIYPPQKNNFRIFSRNFRVLFFVFLQWLQLAIKLGWLWGFHFATEIVLLKNKVCSNRE
jgi:hypothetical protein